MTAPTLTRPSSSSASWLRARPRWGACWRTALGWAFADLDELVIRAAGRTVPEIFAAEGRRASARARAARCARGGRSSAGSWSRPAVGPPAVRRTWRRCWSAGRVIALGVSPEEAIRRAGGASGRPLLDGKADPVGEARRLLRGATGRSTIAPTFACRPTGGRRGEIAAGAPGPDGRPAGGDVMSDTVRRRAGRACATTFASGRFTPTCRRRGDRRRAGPRHHRRRRAGRRGAGGALAAGRAAGRGAGARGCRTSSASICARARPART